MLLLTIIKTLIAMFNLSRSTLLITILCCIPIFAQCKTIWDADLLSPMLDGNSTVNLTMNGATVKRLDTSQIKMLIDSRDRISAQSGTYAKVLISDEPFINAYAISTNGANTVTVTLEMLEMLGNDTDQYGALMGHEITHIANHHMAGKVAVNTILNILGAIAGAALDAKLQNTRGAYQGIGNDLASLGTELASSAFSRSEEKEADEYGFRFMTQAGYDPSGAVRLHTGLLNHNGNNNSFFATHPSSIERIQNMNQMIAKYEASKNTQVASYTYSQPTSSTTSSNSIAETATVPTINVTGQVGIVLTLKNRYNYVILSGTTAEQLPEGLRVNIVSANNKITPAIISRAVDGYYSAIVDGDIYHIAQGDAITIPEGHK